MPIIPIIAGLLGLTGAGTLIWYYSKSESERQQLDSKAERLAQAWFDKKVRDLNVGQLKQVYDEVKKLS